MLVDVASVDAGSCWRRCIAVAEINVNSFKHASGELNAYVVRCVCVYERRASETVYVRPPSRVCMVNTMVFIRMQFGLFLFL